MKKLPHTEEIRYDGPKTAVHVKRKKDKNGEITAIEVGFNLAEEWADFTRAYVNKPVAAPPTGASTEPQWKKPDDATKNRRVKTANLLNDIVFGGGGLRAVLEREGIDRTQAAPEQQFVLQQLKERLTDICEFNIERTVDKKSQRARMFNRYLTQNLLDQRLEMGKEFGDPPPAAPPSLIHLSKVERNALMQRPEAQILYSMNSALNRGIALGKVLEIWQNSKKQAKIDFAHIADALDESIAYTWWSYSAQKGAYYSPYLVSAAIKRTSTVLVRSRRMSVGYSNKFGSAEDSFGVHAYTPDMSVPPPPTAIVDTDFMRHLKEAMGELSEQQRDMLTMKMQGFTLEEIGVPCNIGPDAVRTHLNRILGTLRDALDEHDFEIVDRNLGRLAEKHGRAVGKRLGADRMTTIIKAEPLQEPPRSAAPETVASPPLIEPPAIEEPPPPPATPRESDGPAERKSLSQYASLGGAITIFRDKKNLSLEGMANWIRDNTSQYLPPAPEENKKLQESPAAATALLQAVEQDRHMPSEGFFFNILRALGAHNCINDDEKTALGRLHDQLSRRQPSTPMMRP